MLKSPALGGTFQFTIIGSNPQTSKVMLHPHLGVYVFFGWLGNDNLDCIDVVFRLSQDISLLQVFGYLDFKLYAVPGDSPDGVLLKLVSFEGNVDDFFVGAVMYGSENVVANHRGEYRISAIFSRFLHSSQKRFF